MIVSTYNTIVYFSLLQYNIFLNLIKNTYYRCLESRDHLPNIFFRNVSILIMIDYMAYLLVITFYHHTTNSYFLLCDRVNT